MTPAEQTRLAEQVEKQINGTISEEEFAELETLLVESQSARALYLDLTNQHAHLEEMGESLIQEELKETHQQAARFVPWGIGIAAALVLGLFLIPSFLKPPVVATLVASDHASWESSLPTSVNSPLTPGFLKLRSGVATIRFASGAEVILEAPAHLVLETAMRGRLLEGSAVIDVPESAIGFVLSTPDGYAIDHGTTFAVSVDQKNQISSFEVLAGEISVHHSESGDEKFLGDAERIDLTASGLSQPDPRGEKGQLPGLFNGIRITTKGKETTVIRGNDLDEYLHPHFLMAKHGTVVAEFDRRSIFALTIPSSEDAAFTHATLRLQLVPCGLGFASRLPEISEFSVYALPNFDADRIDSSLGWKNAPQPQDGIRVGGFEVSRGQQTASIEIQSPELTQILESSRGKDVSFLLVRDTDEAKGNGLVHAFASSRHPTASGPTLELK